MIKVFTADDRILLYHMKNVLEAANIECVVKNDNSMALAGEVPSIECWLELWILEGTMQAKASALIQENINANDNSGPNWVCSSCGEKHEPQFSDCWNCGSAQED